MVFVFRVKEDGDDTAGQRNKKHVRLLETFRPPLISQNSLFSLLFDALNSFDF